MAPAVGVQGTGGTTLAMRSAHKYNSKCQEQITGKRSARCPAPESSRITELPQTCAVQFKFNLNDIKQKLQFFDKRATSSMLNSHLGGTDLAPPTSREVPVDCVALKEHEGLDSVFPLFTRKQLNKRRPHGYFWERQIPGEITRSLVMRP